MASETVGGWYTQEGDHWLSAGFGGTYLGTTTGSASYTPNQGSDPPDISGTYIDSGSPVRDGSGSLEIFGDSLTTSASGTAVSIDGGVSTTVTYDDSGDPNKVYISFTIPEGTATGSHTLTLSTMYGSSTTPFQVDDPTPFRTGIRSAQARELLIKLWLMPLRDKLQRRAAVVQAGHRANFDSNGWWNWREASTRGSTTATCARSSSRRKALVGS